MLHLSNYEVKANVEIKVHLTTLLEPERSTLFKTRARLNLNNNDSDQPGIRRNPVNPSAEYFASFLPNPHRLANLPEESGDLSNDGTYTLRGEWIEALEDPKEKDQTSPGARAFVVDYRLAPEHPFPAAVHDIYAAYLYLTQPDHHAITLCTKGSTNPHPSSPILPKDIVLAGDSAGAGVAIAFQLYMRDYVQPSVQPKIEMPPVTVLISAWTDISTSMPSATSKHTYCYTPSPMGVNPFTDESTFYAFPKFNFARTYLCGDSKLVPNERNSAGKHMEWVWYKHLAQHPLVTPVYTADLSGLDSATLLVPLLKQQSGAFDRLADDTRLYAHKLGQVNLDQRVRLELYRDMVHVHQFFEFLPMADKALRAMAEFIQDSQDRYNNSREREGHDDGGCPIAVLEDCWNPETRERAAAKA
ncbi:hypothetical protein BGX23_005524 [Mortierella sp. AD031]|nr:hypothetical protein BGX23_005524 [Mortierella sp. AD031]